MRVPRPIAIRRPPSRGRPCGGTSATLLRACARGVRQPRARRHATQSCGPPRSCSRASPTQRRASGIRAPARGLAPAGRYAPNGRCSAAGSLRRISGMRSGRSKSMASKMSRSAGEQPLERLLLAGVAGPSGRRRRRSGRRGPAGSRRARAAPRPRRGCRGTRPRAARCIRVVSSTAVAGSSCTSTDAPSRMSVSMNVGRARRPRPARSACPSARRASAHRARRAAAARDRPAARSAMAAASVSRAARIDQHLRHVAFAPRSAASSSGVRPAASSASGSAPRSSSAASAAGWFLTTARCSGAAVAIDLVHRPLEVGGPLARPRAHGVRHRRSRPRRTACGARRERADTRRAAR